MLDRHSFVLTTRGAGEGDATLGLLLLQTPDAMANLACKLPHYGKYSYAVFQGDQVSNVQKGQWQISGSALSIDLAPGEQVPPQPIPESTPLSADIRKPVIPPRS